MRHHKSYRVVLRIHPLLIAASLIALAPVDAQDARTDYAAMATKIARMRELGEHPRPAHAPPANTVFTEREINAYLQIEGPSFLPTGIAKPRVSIDGGGRVTGRAAVDLDALSLSQPRGLLDPLAFVRGSVEVVATGSVVASNGRGVAHFESATIAGIPVPKAVAQEVLRFSTRTEQRPDGFAFDTPFELPAQIRSATVDAGRVTVTQ
jgi:hypothetical protein